MAGCPTGKCGTRVFTPPLSSQQGSSNGSSVTLGSTSIAKGYKGNIYYPQLEVLLSSSSGVSVHAHVLMKTGMGILSKAEGDSETFVPAGALLMAGPQRFIAPMRRGFVTIVVSNPRCALGYNFPDKKTRVLHYKKDSIKITWEKSEAIP